MNEPLRDRVAVVTGASSGFGELTSIRLAQAGAAVVLAARAGSSASRRSLAGSSGEGARRSPFAAT